jgi:hypothetical protein
MPSVPSNINIFSLRVADMMLHYPKVLQVLYKNKAILSPNHSTMIKTSAENIV